MTVIKTSRTAVVVTCKTKMVGQYLHCLVRHTEGSTYFWMPANKLEFI